MIVLFIKSDLIKTQSLGGYACPHCHQTTSLEMELRQRYAEFGTMSINPRGVFGVVHCLRCGHTLPASRWTDDMHRAFVRLKTGYKTPRKYWSGLIRIGYGVVAFFVIFSLVMIPLGWKQRTDNDQREARFASATQHPTPGVTLATITNGAATYTAWRVSRMEGQTVWLKRYAGPKPLTDIYSDNTWGAVPDREFSSDEVGFLAKNLADRCLKKTDDADNLTKPCEAVVVAALQ